MSSTRAAVGQCMHPARRPMRRLTKLRSRSTTAMARGAQRPPRRPPWSVLAAIARAPPPAPARPTTLPFAARPQSTRTRARTTRPQSGGGRTRARARARAAARRRSSGTPERARWRSHQWRHPWQARVRSCAAVPRANAAPCGHARRGGSPCGPQTGRGAQDRRNRFAALSLRARRASPRRGNSSKARHSALSGAIQTGWRENWRRKWRGAARAPRGRGGRGTRARPDWRGRRRCRAHRCQTGRSSCR
mmetsp:Transcript_58089/g.126179  ORF Transcript_58089/g.126179 Transcript_58089/m.126179 type:complete len:248 (+) Transcript_58089:61-804(+)